MITGNWTREEQDQILQTLSGLAEGFNPFWEVPTEKIPGSKTLTSDILIGVFNCLEPEPLIVAIQSSKSFLVEYAFNTMQVFYKNPWNDTWLMTSAEGLNLACFENRNY